MSDTEAEKPTEPTPAATATPEAESEVPAQETKTEEAKPAETEEPKSAETAKPEAEAAAESEIQTAEDQTQSDVVAVAAAEGKAETEEVAAEVDQEIKEEEPEPIEIPDGNGELVLVTGATGYLASHILKQLVESGQFKVRATVRSIEGNEKLDKLKSLVQDSKHGLEFVEADLTKPESWTDAVKGCDYVIHTASPFPVTEPADANEVIEPAKNGTMSVLKACVATGTVKRVVLTSSIAAINSGRTMDKNVCTEDTWADVEKSPSAYDKSKAIAEKAAWDYIKGELPEDSSLELSVVNPGFIVGPPLMKLDSTSIEVFKKLMNRDYPVLPKLSFACVDVRDVALAHIRAMMIKQAAGHRHIVCGAPVWLKDMANIMSQEFSSQGFNIPTSQAPYVLVWIKSQFDPVIKRILPSIGKVYNYDTKRMRQVLQVEPREIKDSLLEMGHAMINLEIVQKVEKPEKKQKKLTFRKKKEVAKDIEEGEEKKDEPEKAASTSGSGDDAAVTIEEVEVTTADKGEASVEEASTNEVKAEEEKPVEGATNQSEDEATTSDPESKKSDKKEKPKKEKKEKKKGFSLLSFSFKKNKKPHVEKKSTDEGEAGAEETPAAAEDSPAANAEETPAATEETPAASTDETPTVATDETPVATAEETPATTTEESPATAEETPAETKNTAPDTTTEETPAPAPTSVEAPTASSESSPAAPGAEE